MADNADDIRQSIKKSRQEIADTCSAITEKVSVLEGRVQESVDEVKRAFDLHYQVQQRPWLMFGGSVLVGCALGRRGSMPAATADTSSEALPHVPPQQSIPNEVRNKANDELATIKGAVFGAVISTLWAMAKQVLVPPGPIVDGDAGKAATQFSDSRHTTNRVVAAKTNGRF